MSAVSRARRGWTLALTLLALAGLAACSGSDGTGELWEAPGLRKGEVTLAGSVLRAPGLVMDTDVNDPTSAYAPNDVPAQAQSVGSPHARVSGFVNKEGAGEEGRSKTAGDVDDYFRVELTEGRAVELVTADAAADLDLYLYDPDDPAVPLDASVTPPTAGGAGVENLVVPVTGIYLVRVTASAGASAYSLSFPPEDTIRAAGTWRLSDDFARDEAIVRFGGTWARAARAPAPGIATLAGGEGRNALLSLGTGEDRSRALRSLGVPELPGGSRDEARQKLETLLAIKGLRALEGVVAAAPNYIRRANAIPNDPLFPRQWHYEQINLPRAWDVIRGSPDVLVAVVDTGIASAHPDLGGVLVPGYDFIRDPARALDGDGIDPDPEDPGDGGGFPSSSFHGTHVAGTVAAATDNGEGVAGVAWGARVMPLRALGFAGAGTDYDIEQAIRYAAGLANDSGTVPAVRADVINLSLGGSGANPLLAETLALARQAGVIVVAAAGNEASSRPNYPSDYPGVVSVSAVGQDAELAPYSNFGPHVDVAAPGGDTRADLDADGYADGVLSPLDDDSATPTEHLYRYYQGTSMATPHVAGVAALMKSAHPALTPEDFDRLLAAGELTRDLGARGRDDRYGHGLLDAYRAVTAALRAAGGTLPDPPPLLAAFPRALTLFSDTALASLRLENAGGGSLALAGVTEDSGGWLTVEATEIDPGGLGSYRLRFDTRQLAEGAHSAVITAAAASNTVQVPVTVVVNRVPLAPGSAAVWAILADPETGSVLRARALGSIAGRMNFRFDEVPPGEYILGASTNLDNDDVYCGTGEVCGETVLTVAPDGEHRSDLEIVLGGPPTDQSEALRRPYRR